MVPRSAPGRAKWSVPQHHSASTTGPSALPCGVSSYSTEPSRSPSSRPNFGHIYFAMDDLDAVHARAKALGCLHQAVGDGNLPMGEVAVRPWGERSFYADDPFGNPLCFVDSATLFRGD